MEQWFLALFEHTTSRKCWFMFMFYIADVMADLENTQK
jgi:hypothetical protein